MTSGFVAACVVEKETGILAGVRVDALAVIARMAARLTKWRNGFRPRINHPTARSLNSKFLLSFAGEVFLGMEEEVGSNPAGGTLDSIWNRVKYVGADTEPWS